LNTKDYTYLLNKPYSLNDRQTTELESILKEFPYLQSARAIYLKGLYNRDSFRYNTELKKTAAYTTDRTVLFDFITSEEFRSIDKTILEDQEKEVAEIIVNDSQVVSTALPENKLEQSILLSIQEADAPEQITIDDVIPLAPIPEKLEESIKLIIKEADGIIEDELPVIKPELIEAVFDEVATKDVAPNEPKTPEVGRPLEFNAAEKHSFAEWLQLSKIAPVKRDDTPKEPIVENLYADKYDLIDKFIEANPKIAPVKKDAPTPVNSNKSVNDGPGLMTETLARVYLEQKKYTKAIQAYEILILKYPEKNAFFADRILEVKNLQQNNN
jgi:hypothetical protein